MHDVGHRAAELAVHVLHAAERNAGDRRAVVGVLARDDDVLAGLAFERPVVPHEPERRVVGFRSGRAEKHLVDRFWREFGQFLRQKHRRRRRTFEEGVVVGQLQHLLVGDLGQFLAAVADGHAPEAGHAVEDGVALAVVDVGAIGAHDHARSGGAKLIVVGEGMEMMRGVDRLQLLQGIILISHGLASPN